MRASLGSQIEDEDEEDEDFDEEDFLYTSCCAGVVCCGGEDE